MNITHLDRHFQLFLRDLLARRGFNPDLYCTEIAPRDEMFYKGVLPGYDGDENISLFKYIESALRTFDIYGQLVAHLGGFSAIGPVLDFGSGYGRVTRSLVHCLPPGKIWVADIYPDAVAWQAETFGVNGLVSVRNPDRFALEQQHTLVLAGSVFSHLPDGLFQRWLSKLYRLIAPEGLLAISVHSEALLPEGETIGPDGFRFLGWSESESLGAEVYGMSYVTEAYMAKAIAQIDPGRTVLYRRFQKALYENQDLYIVAGEEATLSELRPVVTPMGWTTGVEQKNGIVEYAGSGIDLNPDHQIIRAELYLQNDQIATTTPAICDVGSKYFPAAPNLPVSWAFRVPKTLGSPSDILRTNLVSSSKAIAYCYAGVPKSAEPGNIRRT